MDAQLMLFRVAPGSTVFEVVVDVDSLLVATAGTAPDAHPPGTVQAFGAWSDVDAFNESTATFRRPVAIPADRFEGP